MTSSGSVNGPNTSTITERCSCTFMDVFMSEQFAQLCSLLLENFEGFKTEKLFDLNYINTRMKEEAYEESPLLFQSDIQEVLFFEVTYICLLVWSSCHIRCIALDVYLGILFMHNVWLLREYHFVLGSVLSVVFSCVDLGEAPKGWLWYNCSCKVPIRQNYDFFPWTGKWIALQMPFLCFVSPDCLDFLLLMYAAGVDK